MTTEPLPHETSLAVWAAPPSVIAGERFMVKVGARSAAGVSLAGSRVEFIGGGTSAVCRLGETPWQGTGALFWSEIELCAPAAPGLYRYAVRFDAAGAAEPHRETEASFSVTVVPRPEHWLAVSVMASGAPVEDAHVRFGPYRAITGSDGGARFNVAKGRHDLIVWKAGYDVAPVPLDVSSDVNLTLEATMQTEDEPDARWTA